MTVNILNLPGWEVIAVAEGDHDYTVIAQYTPQPGACPRCGVTPPTLYRFGTRENTFHDLPSHGRRVGILVRRQRYKCRNCGGTFLEPLPDMDDRRVATRRLVEWIERESLRRTFVSVAEESGVHEKTVRNIFTDYVGRLDAEREIVTPRWLGIDEIHLLRAPRGVIANVELRTLVDLLPDRTRDTITRYLMRLPERQAVEWVAMDMHRPYRDAARTILPQARVVVDKFHVVRMASQALDEVRKDVRSGLTPAQRRQLMHDRFILLRRPRDLAEKQRLVLEVWTTRFPLLGEAYRAKEAFYDLWSATDQAEARDAYDAWCAGLSSGLRPFFKPLTTAVGNWQQEIFAHFDSSLTNAYTEAVNSVIKLTNRIGRGYSFDVIRAKMVHGLNRSDRRPALWVPTTALRVAESRPAYRARDGGVPLSTLAGQLQRGELEG